MAIIAECTECGVRLNVAFAIDSDGDGSASVERCECSDEQITDVAVQSFREDYMWDEINDLINDNTSQFIDDHTGLANCVDDMIKEAVRKRDEASDDEVREALAKEVISNIVGKYNMIPKVVEDPEPIPF